MLSLPFTGGLRPPPPFGSSLKDKDDLFFIIFDIFLIWFDLCSVSLIIFRTLMCAKLFFGYVFPLLSRIICNLSISLVFNDFIISWWCVKLTSLAWRLECWVRTFTIARIISFELLFGVTRRHHRNHRKNIRHRVCANGVPRVCLFVGVLCFLHVVLCFYCRYVYWRYVYSRSVLVLCVLQGAPPLPPWGYDVCPLFGAIF